MNDYQIISDIGRSKHAMVYKGRKKKTIEFFALKCVDKSQKHKVMREVRFLHRLQTPYAVHFYEWFETANHLWLILELCPGNRLLDLLQADLKLPESSVNSLALNMLAALQFLHSNGIVFNNLKPSAVIIDSTGLLKLSDFSLAMHTNTYNGPQSEESKRCKRGTPTYMAPELFRPDGVCSFSSDLWSLGCIMYELASGRPPVLKSNFKALVTAVITEPYAPLVSCSQEFNSLCNALLAKGLLDRPDWEAVRLHAFWQHELPYAEMPADPALEEFCEVLMEERRQMRGEEEDELSGAGGAAGAPRASRSDPVRSSGVDLMRLSQQVQLNRARESSGSYPRAQTTGEAAGALEGQGDVELAGPDDEVDFEPHDAEGAHSRDEQEEEEARDVAQGLGEQVGDADDDEEYGGHDSYHALAAGEDSIASQAARILPFGEVVAEAEEEATSAAHVHAPRGEHESAEGQDHDEFSVRDGAGLGGGVAGGGGGGGARGTGGKVRPISAPLVGANKAGAVQAAGQQLLAQPSASRVGGPGTSGEGFLGRPMTSFASVADEGSRAGLVPLPVAQLLFCVSDLQVRPIVGNKKIENVPMSSYDAAALPFEHADTGMYPPPHMTCMYPPPLLTFRTRRYSHSRKQGAGGARDFFFKYPPCPRRKICGGCQGGDAGVHGTLVY